jgi:hypothetical protein
MIPFLAAMLPVASLAQSQSGTAQGGVPSAAIPKTTGVMVIQTIKQGVTASQVMAIIPDEIRTTVKLYLEDEARAIMDTCRSQRSS